MLLDGFDVGSRERGCIVDALVAIPPDIPRVLPDEGTEPARLLTRMVRRAGVDAWRPGACKRVSEMRP